MSDPSPPAAPLPRPAPGELAVYLVGPGFGESAVVLLGNPDRTCIVVDSCMRGDQHLTLAVLDALDVKRIDLLVVTHPDLDHMRGIPALVAAQSIRRLWKYPGGTIRDLAAGWCRDDPSDHRLQELHAALAGLEDTGVACDACLQTRSATLADDCHVTALAPTQADQSHERRRLRPLVEHAQVNAVLGAKIRSYLLGDRDALGDHANTLSLAIRVRFRDHRVLLAGDVENGRGSEPRSGWKGVVMHLREDKRIEEVTSLDVVKVAHHGSIGAFDVATWRLHARTDGTTTAVLTPFSASSLPDQPMLEGLREYVSRVGITADTPGAFGRALAAGWNLQNTTGVATPGPVLAIVLGDGAPRLHAGPEASFFERVAAA